jgi:hypothetical protein
MIPVARVAEPVTFDATTRAPGKAWLRTHASGRPRDFWSKHLPALATGFRDLCGYAAMLDPTGGTVDHYLGCKAHRELAYEWSNYRFASQVMNGGAKRSADDAVLDPYEVGDGWFEIILPSLQMRATSKVPAKHRKRAEATLALLKLRDGERIVRWRRHWYAMYQSGGMTLDQLSLVAPLIAAAVIRGPVVPAAERQGHAAIDKGSKRSKATSKKKRAKPARRAG